MVKHIAIYDTMNIMGTKILEIVTIGEDEHYGEL